MTVEDWGLGCMSPEVLLNLMTEKFGRRVNLGRVADLFLRYQLHYVHSIPIEVSRGTQTPFGFWIRR